MFGLIKKTFIGLWTSLAFNAFSHTNCVFLSNKNSEIQPTFINLYPNEYSQEYYGWFCDYVWWNV